MVGKGGRVEARAIFVVGLRILGKRLNSGWIGKWVGL